MTSPPNATKEDWKLEKGNKILGILGILPKGCRGALSKAGAQYEDITQERLKTISKIFANTALEAHRRVEEWQRFKRYGS